MIGKILFIGFISLVILGLGISGTLNAAKSGYHKIEDNPTVQELQQKAVNAADSQIHKVVSQATNESINAINQKIGSVLP